MEIRRAQPADAAPLIGFDEIARTEPRRVAFIHRVVASPTCFVAVERDTVVAYADLTYALYDVGLIDMLYISRPFRRRGIGSTLVLYLEQQCTTPKLFTSTSQSNLPMQALLAKLGYRPSGVIEDLNDDEPELMFMKHLGNKAV
jgi:GNAT superfamily N-acetyltransferase